MTLINSPVEICNLALGYLGSQAITSIENPTTTDAVTCALYYDITRQALLESYNWSFAKRRVALASSSETPAFGWSYKSTTFPSDYLKLCGLYDSNGYIIINTNREYYELEGNSILTDLEAPYNMVYIRDEIDVTKMDRIFVNLLAVQLAMAILKKVGGSGTTFQALQQQQDVWEAKAVSINQQQNPPLIVSSSKYIRERVV